MDDGTITAHKDGNYGSSYPRVHEFGDDGVPFLTAKLLDDSGRIDLPGAPRLAEERANDLNFGFIERNDVLLSHNATVGRVAVVPKLDERVLVGTSLTYYRVDHKRLLPRYLAAFFRGRDFQNQLAAVMSHSTRNQVPITAQRQLSVVVPPLGEQKAIAGILGALDDKIELNRRMNETLEAMAQTIFKSWFVDFDPVRAKLDGRQPPGLDAETAALFPDGFEHVEGELIPSGWSLRRMSELVEVVKGRSYKSSELAESETALVTLKSIQRGGGYRTDGLKPYTGTYRSNQRLVPGEVVVSFTDVTQAAEVIGKPAIVRSDDRYRTLVASLDLGIVRPISRSLSVPFLYCLFLTDDFQDHSYAHCSGTTVLHLSKEAIPGYSAITPPDAIASAFAQLAKPLFMKIDENDRESKTLAATRDALLPKLLSGEIRVGDAEEVLEATA